MRRQGTKKKWEQQKARKSGREDSEEKRMEKRRRDLMRRHERQRTKKTIMKTKMKYKDGSEKEKNNHREKNLVANLDISEPLRSLIYRVSSFFFFSLSHDQFFLPLHHCCLSSIMATQHQSICQVSATKFFNRYLPRKLLVHEHTQNHIQIIGFFT